MVFRTCNAPRQNNFLSEQSDPYVELRERTLEKTTMQPLAYRYVYFSSDVLEAQKYLIEVSTCGALGYHDSYSMMSIASFCDIHRMRTPGSQ